jgi:glycosyltransferase involved in cell wall biosynthesis
MRSPKRISVVIPFFNEEANVAETVRQLRQHLLALDRYAWQIVAVNDGSRDSTLARLQDVVPAGFDLTIVDLSRNFGKEAALTAGLDHADGDAVVVLDADLQDPPALLKDMLARWEAGYEVVLAVRRDRRSDTLFKRVSARGFYRIINWLSDIAIPENVGDFRLMDRCVVEALRQLPENRRFMKGLFAWAGFRSTSLDYVRPERSAGRTKFSAWRLWNLALEGVTSFSTAPLRIWTYLGFVIALLAFCYGAFIVARTLIEGVDVPGYASLLTVVLFLGGIQLIGLGVLGEYLGRTYVEAKRRPTYVVRSVVAKRAPAVIADNDLEPTA